LYHGITHPTDGFAHAIANHSPVGRAVSKTILRTNPLPHHVNTFEIPHSQAHKITHRESHAATYDNGTDAITDDAQTQPVSHVSPDDIPK
jgi:hypothetical protein